MEKEKDSTSKFKLKFPKFFSSSCITQDISKVIVHHNQKPIFTSKSPLMAEEENEQEQYGLINPFSNPVIRAKYQYQTPVLTCKPRCPESFDQMVKESCIIPAAGNPIPRRKFAGRYSLLSPAGDCTGRRCPPASPASPLFQKKNNKTKRKTKKKKHHQRSKNGGFGSSFDNLYFKNHNPYGFSSSNETDFFSSDDEREEDEDEDEYRETRDIFCSSKSLSFSSKSISLSSDSEHHGRTRVRHRRRRSESKVGSSRFGPRKEEMEVAPLQGKVKDTFAVVKSSSDPYNDFRTSMVEMIIEKQIFGERELEQLLRCFLSLNSTHHHRVIVEVFTEIWDALFSHRS